MDNTIKFAFMERFDITTKLEFCFGISQMILELLYDQDKENIDELKRVWAKNIRERFNANINLIKEQESIDENEMKLLEQFLESILTEMKLK